MMTSKFTSLASPPSEMAEDYYQKGPGIRNRNKLLKTRDIKDVVPKWFQSVVRLPESQDCPLKSLRNTWLNEMVRYLNEHMLP